jgi:hypothetical protein
MLVGEYGGVPPKIQDVPIDGLDRFGLALLALFPAGAALLLFRELLALLG